MSEPSDTPVTAYLKGHMAGLGGILGSDRPEWAMIGAMHADDERRKSADSGAASGDAGVGLLGLFVLALLSPPFFAPVLALGFTWQTLGEAQWHPLFIVLVCLAQLTLMIVGVW